MTIYMYYTLCSHLLHLLCGCHVTHVMLFTVLYIYIYIYIYIFICMVYFLYKTGLTLAIFKTGFSGTTCLIAMKLIHDREGGM